MFPGDTGVARGIISTKYYHVSPRVGFRVGSVWRRQDLDSRRRGHLLTALSPAMSGTSPAMPFHSRCGHRPARVLSIPSPISIPTPGDFPSTAPGGGIFPYIYSPSKPIFISGPGGATETISPHFKYPYIYQFNLSVQRQLPGQRNPDGGVCRCALAPTAQLYRRQLRAVFNRLRYAKHFGYQHRRPASVRSLRRSLSHWCGRHQQWHRRPGSSITRSAVKPDSQLPLPSSLGDQAALPWLQRERFLCLEPRAR